MRLGVVIPTRDRAQLAIIAIRALLEQPCDLQVLVSDNSSADTDVELLAAFCAEVNDPRLVRVRPPRELSMPAHWEWALREAVTRFDSTHFTIHYDRKAFRPGHLALLTQLGARYPDELITYPSDFTAEHAGRIVLWQMPVTGSVVSIRTQRIAELFAAGSWAATAQTAPILSNCIVPGAKLERLRARFGSYCDSTAPDSCFWFRYAALEERTLHYDRSLAVLHHGERGNGYRYQRGHVSPYRRPFGEVSWLSAAPIPGLDLGLNALYHEYELVRRETGDRLPPIDRDGYLRDLASFIRLLPDEAARAALGDVLRQQGYDEPLPQPTTPRKAPWHQRVRQRLVLLAADGVGRVPRNLSGFEFRTNREAVRYAMRYPRPVEARSDYLAALQPEPWNPR
jgi:glycosyltransferase involved in cell wall biosynthesis